MEYSKLRPDQKLYAKKAIYDILFEAQQCSLHRGSVTINVQHHQQYPMVPSTAHMSQQQFPGYQFGTQIPYEVSHHFLANHQPNAPFLYHRPPNQMNSNNWSGPPEMPRNGMKTERESPTETTIIN